VLSVVETAALENPRRIESVESNYETTENARAGLPIMEVDKWIANSLFGDAAAFERDLLPLGCGRLSAGC
jgi:hypothetical protein